MAGKKGTREMVYSLLRKVPDGKVTTYGELARASGTHPRAVAAFMRANRDTAGTPCFRVVRSDGGLGGYSAGTGRKIRLLERDGIEVKEGRLDLKRHLHRF